MRNFVSTICRPTVMRKIGEIVLQHNHQLIDIYQLFCINAWYTNTVKLRYNVLLGTGKIGTLYPRYIVTKKNAFIL